MKVIGITGGVGAGKTTVLAMLRELCSCTAIVADDVAKEMMSADGPLAAEARRLFGEKAYLPDGELNRAHIAAAVYGSGELLEKWNSVVHPAVNRKICGMIKEAADSGLYDFIFVEAALLIENGYDRVCDELWYVYADEAARVERLRLQRGYDEARSRDIMRSQLDDGKFREACDFVIDTGRGFEHTRRQLQNRLEVYGQM